MSATTHGVAGAGNPADLQGHSGGAVSAKRGIAARQHAPRTRHSELTKQSDRDPVAILTAGDDERVAELVPIRYARMLVSPFTFYRGAAAVMAHDLAGMPRSGLDAQLCGDAHLSNFGGFASPSRDLVFDLNDFDESLPGPFEWDVKRLAASFEIAGRDLGHDDRQRGATVASAVRAYREAMRTFATMNNLAVWYSRMDAAEMTARLRSEAGKKPAKTMERNVAKAQAKDSMKAFSKLTHDVEGEPRIISQPPYIVPIAELIEEDAHEETTAGILDIFAGYQRSLQADRRSLLKGFKYVDLARKVVGVGSVGTRCWILLLMGRDHGDPLFLQIKEASPSALEPALGRSEFRNHGQRVVEGQRLMQAASDIFLGWVRVEKGLDGKSRDFYVRQLWDWKTSADLTTITARGLQLYAEACGWTLARAHARSGDRVAIAAYLGKGEVFDRAVADFAKAYADLNERDYAAVLAAAAAGRIEVAEGQ
jgi:uncharacterized protein (DUF2252 family)